MGKKTRENSFFFTPDEKTPKKKSHSNNNDYHICLKHVIPVEVAMPWLTP
jgi:hypothetical protein